HRNQDAQEGQELLAPSFEPRDAQPQRRDFVTLHGLRDDRSPSPSHPPGDRRPGYSTAARGSTIPALLNEADQALDVASLRSDDPDGSSMRLRGFADRTGAGGIPPPGYPNDRTRNFRMSWHGAPMNIGRLALIALATGVALAIASFTAVGERAMSDKDREAEA